MTPEEIEARLAKCWPAADTFQLSGDRLESRHVQDLLASLGLEELLLESATVTRSGTEITVTGKASPFLIDGMGATATFTAGEALSVTLVLELPADAHIEVPFIGLEIGHLTVTASVSGPSLDLPAVSIALGAQLTHDGRSVPVTLTPGTRGWILRAGRIGLPRLRDVASLLGFPPDAVAGVIPRGLADLGGSIEEFICEIDPDRWAVSSISARVETDANGEWSFAPAPFPALKKPIVLTVGVEFPQVSDDGRDDNGATATKPILTGSLTAAMKIGEKLTVPVRVAREADAWRLGVLSATGFPTVGELIGLVSNTKVADALPAALGTLGLESSSFEVTLPDHGPRVVSFDARLKDHWTIVEGMVEVQNASLHLHVGADDDISAFFAGTVEFGEHGEVEVPIAVERSADSGAWTLRLACSRRDLPGVSALAQITKGATLPPDLPALELSEFTVVFGGQARKTEVVLKADLKGPWAPPGVDDLGVREAALQVKVEQPADGGAPHVAAVLLLTLEVASVPVPVVAKWESA